MTEMIIVWQNPQDCSAGKFLVINNHNFSSIDESINYEMKAFTTASNLNRVLIYNSDASTALKHSLDSNEKESFYCVDTSKADCYFQNLSNCPKPESKTIKTINSFTLALESSEQFISLDKSIIEDHAREKDVPKMLKSVHKHSTVGGGGDSEDGVTKEEPFLQLWYRFAFTNYRISPKRTINQ